MNLPNIYQITEKAYTRLITLESVSLKKAAEAVEEKRPREARIDRREDGNPDQAEEDDVGQATAVALVVRIILCALNGRVKVADGFLPVLVVVIRDDTEVVPHGHLSTTTQIGRVERSSRSQESLRQRFLNFKADFVAVSPAQEVVLVLVPCSVYPCIFRGYHLALHTDLLWGAVSL